MHIEKKEVYDTLIEILNIDLSEYSQESMLNEIENFIVKKLIWEVVSNTAEKLKDDKIDTIKEAPDKLREALAFSFDTKIGLDFFEDAERLYNELHNIDKVVKSGCEEFDKLLSGGFHEKSLTLFLGASNIGKTLVMCAFACNALLQNKNVLYVTLEMSEDKISERIMANIMDIEMNDLRLITKEKFLNKFLNIKSTIKNKLIIKEYPTRGINTNHIRNLLKELKVRKKFEPDIIFVDYLGIMLPIQIRKEENTYTEVKRISEELRGLSVESTIPIVSGIQTNRDGFNSSDLELTDVADSIGTVATSDIIVGIVQSDEYRQAGKYAFIILKNRYGINKKKTVVNVSYNKMRITQDKVIEKNNLTTSTNIIDDASVEVLSKMKQQGDIKKKKIINFDPEESEKT